MTAHLVWGIFPTFLLVSGPRMSILAQDTVLDLWNTSTTPGPGVELTTWSTSEDIGNATSVGRNVTIPMPDLVPRPEDEDRTVKWIYIPLATIGIIGNCLFLVGLSKSARGILKTSRMFLLNQAAIDLVGCVLIIPVKFLNNFTDNMSDGATADFICRFWSTDWLLWAVFVTSTINLLFLTMQLYFAISKIEKLDSAFTPVKTKVMIGLTWILGFTYEGLYMILTSKFTHGRCALIEEFEPQDAQKYVGIVLIILEFFVPVIIFIIAYARIVKSLGDLAKNAPPKTLVRKAAKKYLSSSIFRRQFNDEDIQAISSRIAVRKVNLKKASSVKNGSLPTAGNEHTHMDKPMEMAVRSLFKSMVYAAAAFFICWIWCEMYLLLYFLDYSLSWDEWFYYTGVILVTSNGSITPFIYCMHYTQVHYHIRKIYFEKILKEEDRHASESGY